MTASLISCRNSTTGHPHAGGDQILPGPTIALGLFPQLSAAPYGKISVLQCSDIFHLGICLRGFIMLRLRLFSSGFSSKSVASVFLDWPPKWWCPFSLAVNLSWLSSFREWHLTWLSFFLTGFHYHHHIFFQDFLAVIYSFRCSWPAVISIRLASVFLG
jgi:hypothetical protein